LRGKKILFEFDPSAPYERLVRDYAIECKSWEEIVIVLTKKGTPIYEALKDDDGIELVEIDDSTLISDILNHHSKGNLDLIYDNLTDLSLSFNNQTAYKFASNAISLLNEPRVSSLFLVNTVAHNPQEVSSIKALYTSQVSFSNEGITSVKIN
jgi:hypothetical protein